MDGMGGGWGGEKEGWVGVEGVKLESFCNFKPPGLPASTY
jgi:hypothetical protein